jgi:hypothetical protein
VCGITLTCWEYRIETPFEELYLLVSRITLGGGRGDLPYALSVTDGAVDTHEDKRFQRGKDVGPSVPDQELYV